MFYFFEQRTAYEMLRRLVGSEKCVRDRHDIEKRKFFGRASKNDEAGKFDTEGSIGNLVDDAIRSGDASPQREQELFELLQARFVGGEQTPSTIGQTIRDLGYMGTIANPI